MKNIMKALMLIAVLFFCPFANQANAAAPCGDVSKIEFAEVQPAQAVMIINAAFVGFKDYYSPANGRYELCFDIPDSMAVTIAEVLKFEPEKDAVDKDIYIDGLVVSNAMASDQPMLKVTNASEKKIVLHGLALSNVKSGLELAGTGPIEVINSKITGDASKSGACISVKSDGAVVKHTDVSSCQEGIKIEASNTNIGAANVASYDADKNTIHGNSYGIHVASGNGNKYAYNSIYQNKVVGEEASADNGIKVDSAAAASFFRPELILEPESKLALRCTSDSDGKITKREVWFDKAIGQGEVVFYQVVTAEFNQGESLITHCEVDANGICTISDWPTEVKPDEKTCGLADTFVTVLFAGASTSMYLSEPFELDGIFSVPMPPIDLPTTSGVTVDNPNGDPSNLPEGYKGEPTNTGGVTVGPGEVGGLGAAAGCKSQLAAGDVENIAYALILLIPAVVLVIRRACLRPVRIVISTRRSKR